MPSWIRKGEEQTVPQEQMLNVYYLRFCPSCDNFKPQETSVEGQDHIVKCMACNSAERFKLVNGVLVPEGTLKLLKGFTKLRVKEILGK